MVMPGCTVVSLWTLSSSTWQCNLWQRRVCENLVPMWQQWLKLRGLRRTRELWLLDLRTSKPDKLLWGEKLGIFYYIWSWNCFSVKPGHQNLHIQCKIRAFTRILKLRLARLWSWPVHLCLTYRKSDRLLVGKSNFDSAKEELLLLLLMRTHDGTELNTELCWTLYS